MVYAQPRPGDEELMAQAIAIANRAYESNGKVGIAALLAWRGEILALEPNTATETGNLTAHAEMTALVTAAQRLNALSDDERADITIYSTLEPCLMCLSAISFVNIKRIVWAAYNRDATDDAWISREVTTEGINKGLVRGQIELVGGVLRDEGNKLLGKMGMLVKD